MKFKRILEGQQALIRNHLGEGKVIEGPARVFLFRQRLEPLRRYTATLNEYLVIKDNTGLITHKPGPCFMFLNPLEHHEIRVQSAIQIDGNHLAVVYHQQKDGAVQRRVVQGPTMLMPSANEWLHEFSWHGVDESNKTRMIPGYKKFTLLETIPSQFYYNVRDVRTLDDTMITVKLMIFYQMDDVIKMLETTHDPIADMINAVCSDVIAFAGKISYQEFIKSTAVLSQLETFPQLLARAKRVGFTVNKVVFRGYHASPQLQAMQDAAIKSRTELRLNNELQQQEQMITNLRLQKEQDRTKLKQEIEQRQQEHRQKVTTMKQAHELKQRELRQAAGLEMQALEHRAKLECEEKKHAATLEHWDSLAKNLEVDMTTYLVNVQGSAPVAEQIEVLTERRLP